MYRIGDFSKLCRIPVKTLRYYDDLGILTPDFIDKYSGYRYYNPSKLLEVYKLLSLKELGFTLDEIKEYLSGTNVEGVTKLIASKRQELSNEADQLQIKIDRLDALSKNLSQEGEYMSNNVLIKQNEPIRLATIRYLVKDRSEIKKVLDAIKACLDKAKVKYTDLSAIINYDTEYCTENLDLEIGVQITTPLPKNNCKELQVFPDNYRELQSFANVHGSIQDKLVNRPTKTASTICSNTQDDIEKAYSSITQYNEENRYQVIGAYYEYYYDGNTVELQMPVYKLPGTRLKEPRNDDINVPFKNDENIVGKWEFIDLLPTKEHFCPDKTKHTGCKPFKEIYFLPNGEKYWCYGWTKGCLIASYGDSHGLFKYTIEKTDGQEYMFVEYKSGDYFFYGWMPEILVLKKVDGKSYTKDEIRIYEKTDYPFIPDDSVLGKWFAVDYIEKIEEFDPTHKSFQTGDLFFKYAHFNENGEYEVQFGDNIYNSPTFTWTKGLVLHHSVKTAPAYIIKRINGIDYLFIEWKSGDYTYAGRKPWYYVFRREG